MAVKVKVAGTKGSGKFMHLEVNGGSSGELGDGSHEFTIGLQGAVVQYLTIRRLGKGNIKVIAETGDIFLEVDNGNPKHIKKGGSFTLSSSAKRAAVRERPHK